MPTIAQFCGIFIQMYFRDHNPPHFHARYGRAKAIFSISNGEMIAGELPPTAIKLVKEWAAEHQAELQGNWDRGQADDHSRELQDPTMANDFPMVDVLRLKPLDGFQLWLRFTDGNEGVRDCSDIIAGNGSMVVPLKDAAYFKRVFVEMGAPTWPNGYDLDPIRLYMELRDAGALKRDAAE